MESYFIAIVFFTFISISEYTWFWDILGNHKTIKLNPNSEIMLWDCLDLSKSITMNFLPHPINNV